MLQLRVVNNIIKVVAKDIIINYYADLPIFYALKFLLVDRDIICRSAKSIFIFF